ncbi:MAG: M48 family metallopeptidase [Nitrospira sp.]|nr:M48 family metallopeptidase [Nitrospira sp.]
MPTPRPAQYLDGRTAMRHPVTLIVTPGALRIVMADGSSRQWPYDQIRQTQGAYHGEPVRLEFGPEPCEALVVATPAVLTDIHATAPGVARHLHNPTKRKARLCWTFGAALGVVFILIGLYRWGIPGLASAIAPYVPVSWEESLGHQVVDRLAPKAQQCRDPERLQKLDRIAQTLAATRPAAPYRITLSVIDNPGINAFAAPGGQVILLRGLLERTSSPEELAGVLAHELQHVYQRHTTKAILEQTTGTLLLTAISGDLSGGLAWGLEGARTVGALHYSRSHEREADMEGLRMMQAAHVNPAAMVAMYERMQHDDPDHPEPPEFLSTHPDMKERVTTLVAMADPSPAESQQLLPEENWTDIRSLCRLRDQGPVTSASLDLP